MESLLGIPIIAFENKKDWSHWLEKNYTNQTGVWIKIAKKSSGIPTITHSEALDEALCYGWIDGQRRGLDDDYFLQKFTPRRKQSLWSKVNIGKVETLIASGRMQTSGLAEIDLAKADGRWAAAYDSQATATVPDDLVAALQQHQQAKDFFDTLTRAERYSVLHKLMTARTLEVRKARLTKILETLARSEKA